MCVCVRARAHARVCVCLSAIGWRAVVVVLNILLSNCPQYLITVGQARQAIAMHVKFTAPVWLIIAHVAG